MRKLATFMSFLGPALVLGALFAFAGYALLIYKPDPSASCQKSGLSQQIDVAVHVVRQWFGREGQLYVSCGQSS